MHINPEWARFVNKIEQALARRQPDSPVIVMVPHIDGRTDSGSVEGEVDFLTYNMRPHFFPFAIIHLVDSFNRACPNNYEAKRIKALCDKLLGTIAATDITNGLN